MQFTELIRLFHSDGLDDIEYKKEDNKIIIGYFRLAPVDLVIIENGYITSIPTLTRWEKTEWLFKLIDDTVLIIDDYFDK